jgi:hypothetical protein
LVGIMFILLVIRVRDYFLMDLLSHPSSSCTFFWRYPAFTLSSIGSTLVL